MKYHPYNRFTGFVTTLFIIMALFSFCSLRQATAEWQIETVHEGGENVGSWTSLAFDASGNPAISYFDITDGDLRFARFSDTSWRVTTIDSAGLVGQFTSLAFDPSDNPAISYFDNTNGDLKFARFNGTSWDITTVDAGDAGLYTSLAFDASGNPAISYHGAGDLKYAHFNGTSWDITTVDSAGLVGQFTSLAFDASGNPTISYHDATNSHLKFARFNVPNPGWNVTTVDSSGNVTGWTSLAFDASGNPAISYFGSNNLKFARFNGTTWIIETVDPAMSFGGHTSLAFDSSGNPAISYFFFFVTPFITSLKFAHFNGTSWDITTINSGFGGGSVGAFNSLAFDVSDNPTISYYDAERQNLKFTRFNGTSWNITIVDGGVVGLSPSLAFDVSGNPAISYFDGSNGEIKFAHFNVPNPGWNVTTVAKVGAFFGGFNTGFTSLAFDPLDNPTISYIDDTDDNLKLARFNGTLWEITPVDSARESFGNFTSLAFDASGNPAIAYFDGINGDIKFAHFNVPNVGWNITTVAFAGSAGGDGSLAFDASGNPAISFFNSFSNDLKFAHFNGVIWDVETVDSAGDVGKFTSLSFDSLGNPAISYHESTNLNLKFAHFNVPNPGWNITTIFFGVTGVAGGFHTSLAFDPLGNPAISYVNPFFGGFGGLQYANFNGATWDVTNIDSREREFFEFTALDFNASGNPAIAYQGGSELRFARFVPVTTTTTTSTTTTTTTTSTTTTTFVCQCPASGNEGCISGTVIYAPNGRPHAGMTVTLKRVSPRPRVKMGAVTDGDGCYRFTELEDGRYKVRVKRCIGGKKKIIVIRGGAKVNGVDFRCK